MKITVDLLITNGGLSREDAVEAFQYLSNLPGYARNPWGFDEEESAELADYLRFIGTDSKKETVCRAESKTEQPRRTAPCGCFVSREEFTKTPLELLDHRIQISVRSELDRTGRSSFWQILSQKPLSEACNAAELGTCFQVLG